MTAVDFALRCELNTIFIRSCPDLTVGTGVVPWQEYLDRLVAIIEEYKRLERPILLQKMFPSSLGDMEYEEGMLEMVQEVCYRRRIENVQVVIRSVVQVGCENKERVQAHKIAIPELGTTRRDEESLTCVDEKIQEDSTSSHDQSASGRSRHEKKHEKTPKKPSEKSEERMIHASDDDTAATSGIRLTKPDEPSRDPTSQIQSTSATRSALKPVQGVSMHTIPIQPVQGMTMQQPLKSPTGVNKTDKTGKNIQHNPEDPFITLSQAPGTY